MMNKAAKIALTISGLTAVSAGVAYVVNQNKEKNSIKEDLFSNFRLYEEYAGSDEMHVREVIAKNKDGKFVQKNSWADGEETGSTIHEMTDKEIKTLKNYLIKEIQWSTPFQRDKHPYHQELFDVYSRIVFNDGAEYEVNAALEL